MRPVADMEASSVSEPSFLRSEATLVSAPAICEKHWMSKDRPDSEQKAWMFLAITGPRHYQGNEGYSDELETVYRYDSNVPNHRQVGAGDFVVLRQDRAVVGAAVIRRVESHPATKIRNLCPMCGSSRLSHRKPPLLPVRCSACKAEFATPDRREDQVTAYSAWYDTFLRPTSPLPVGLFRSAWIQLNDQMSMRALALPALTALLHGSWPAAEDLLRLGGVFANLQPEDGADDDSSPPRTYAPSAADERARVMREIRQRRGQQKFRRSMLRAFGNRCVFSGCRLVDLLEAAHIDPYRGDAGHHRSNGLLLRADLHTLFDLNLLAVDPEALALLLSPSVKGFGYDHLDGLSLDRTAMRHVSREALARRWRLFCSLQGKGSAEF